MTTAKFRELAGNMVANIRMANRTVNACQGAGPRTDRNIEAALGALEAAERLIRSAFEACEGKELTP